MNTFKKITLTIIMIVFGFSVAKAQVAINTNGNPPDGSAMLDVVSTEKGMLIPRLTATQKGNISSPATGLMIYQTTAPTGFYYNSGTPEIPIWQLVGTDAGYWERSGTKTFLANNDDYVGIGTNDPAYPLNVTKNITTGNMYVIHSKLMASDILPEQTIVSAAIVGETNVTNFTFNGNGNGGVGAVLGMTTGTTTHEYNAAGAFFSTVSGGANTGSLGVYMSATGAVERNSGFMSEAKNSTLENTGGQLHVGSDSYESGVTNTGINSYVHNGKINYGAKFFAEGGNGTNDTTYGVYASARNSKINYAAKFEADGGEGTNDTTYGVYATARDGKINYAAQFQADGDGNVGTNDTTYGIYASAHDADKNYAAYFDNGTVYVENTLELNSGVKNDLLSHSLTDDALTTTEINAATGKTASGVGAGWTTYIKDTDGTSKIYQVVSDGINWYFFTATQAAAR